MSKQREQLFGVDTMTAYDPATGLPYGNAKILGAINLNFTGEVIENTGGASNYPWGAEDGLISAEITMTLKEYPSFLFEIFNGAKTTENVAEPLGAISETLTNLKGTSVFSATTGISSISIKSGSEADLASGKYIAVAVSPTTVNIHALNDLDFGNGTSKSYIDDSLKINASPLTVASTDATDIPNFGLEINGGSGTIDMTVGDTATFEVRAPNTGSDTIDVGSTNSVYPEIGLIFSAQRRGDGATGVLEIYRCKGIGLPIGLTPKEWSESEITLKAYLDNDKNKVYTFNRIRKS